MSTLLCQRVGGLLGADLEVVRVETKVDQHAFDALVSICYNIGIGTPNPRKGQKPGFLGSTFLKRIKAGRMADAKAAILDWKKPAAIIGRRHAEADQFVTPYAQALPRPAVSQARIAVAAPVEAVLSPEVVTPVIVPVAPPAPAMPWWRRLAAAFGRAAPQHAEAHA